AAVHGVAAPPDPAPGERARGPRLVALELRGIERLEARVRAHAQLDAPALAARADAIDRALAQRRRRVPGEAHPIDRVEERVGRAEEARAVRRDLDRLGDPARARDLDE